MEVAEELVRLHELGIKGKLGEDDLKVRTTLFPSKDYVLYSPTRLVEYIGLETSL